MELLAIRDVTAPVTRSRTCENLTDPYWRLELWRRRNLKQTCMEGLSNRQPAYKVGTFPKEGGVPLATGLPQRIRALFAPILLDIIYHEKLKRTNNKRTIKQRIRPDQRNSVINNWVDLDGLSLPQVMLGRQSTYREIGKTSVLVGTLVIVENSATGVTASRYGVLVNCNGETSDVGYKWELNDTWDGHTGNIYPGVDFDSERSGL